MRFGAADRTLAAGLSSHAAGVPLSPALGTAMEQEIGVRARVRVARDWTLPWVFWQMQLAGARTYPARDAVLDQCFRWTISTPAGGPHSPLACLVGEGLGAGLGSVDAVRLALQVFRLQEMERRWCLLGSGLYSPREVHPFIASHIQWHGYVPPIGQIASLARWVFGRVQYARDIDRWGVVDAWQSPWLTLSSGSGDCADMSLVLWSAAPLIGFPDEGRLVVGTHRGEGHAWVEFPTLNLLVEATAGAVHVGRPPGYVPLLFIDPNRCVRAG